MSVPLILLSSPELDTGTASLAIWNKKKIIIAIAVGAWVINVIFEIQCKLLPSVKSHIPPLILILPAVVRVNDQPEL